MISMLAGTSPILLDLNQIKIESESTAAQWIHNLFQLGFTIFVEQIFILISRKEYEKKSFRFRSQEDSQKNHEKKRKKHKKSRKNYIHETPYLSPFRGKLSDPEPVTTGQNKQWIRKRYY